MRHSLKETNDLAELIETIKRITGENEDEIAARIKKTRPYLGSLKSKPNHDKVVVKTIIALKEGYNKELSSRIEEGGELKAIKAALIVLMDEAAQNRSIRTGEALPVARQTLTKASEDVLKMM